LLPFYSATFGGGLFIICVVFAAVILAGNADLPVPNRKSYIRDTFAYMVATLATLLLLCLGKLTAVDGLLLLGGYFVYLGICLGTRNNPNPNFSPSTIHPLDGDNGAAVGGHSTSTSGVTNSRHLYANPLHAVGNNDTLRSLDNNDDGLQDAELEMIPFTLHVLNDPGINSAATGHTHHHHQHQQQQQFPLEVMIPKHSGPSIEPQPSIPGKGSFLFDTKLRPRTGGSGGGGGGGVDDDASVVLASPSTDTAQQTTALLHPMSLQRSAAPSGFTVAALKEAAVAWWRDIPHILEETLHLHGKTGIKRYFTYVISPLILCMHATMPTLYNGHTFSMAYATVVAVVAPPFFLVTVFMGPAALGGSVFMTVCFSSTLVLLTLAFVVHPIGSPAQFSSSFILPSSPAMAAVSGGSLGGDASATITTLGSPPVRNTLTPSPLSPSFAAALQPAHISKPSIFTGQRPRQCIFFALLAFLQCILWLNATAEEVVSIFEAIGRIWNVRRDTLGATVLAWGETIPDLVAVVSLSKAGQGTMAIAACFGGPVFNLLVSMGGPVLIASSRTGAIPYQMTSGVVVLVVFTVAVLVGLLVAGPLRYNWMLQRELGWVLLGVYALSQVIFLLAEGIVL
jgi:sodium/potassium/calcium exchanger 6